MPDLRSVPAGAPLRRILAALTAGLALAVSGCGGDDEPASVATGTVPGTADGATLPGGAATQPPSATSPAPPAATATLPSPGGSRSDDGAAAGGVTLPLDGLLRAFSEFAVGAQRCVQGGSGSAEECADKAFAPVEKASKTFDDRIGELREEGSARCRKALDRTAGAKEKLVGVLEDLRDAAATGDQQRYTAAGQRITSVLQGETTDLVAAHTACSG